MNIVRRFDQFHQTIPGYAVFGLVELGAALGFGSWAIDNGDVWLYLITLIFFAGAVQDFAKLVGKVTSGVKARRAR